MHDSGQQFINGKRRSGSCTDATPITNPATGETLATEHLADQKDAEEAVAAATLAFAAWSRTTPAERSEILLRWADVLERRSEEFVTTESQLGGKPVKLARGFDIPGVIDNVRFFAGAARNLEGTAAGEYSGEHTSTIRREPIGVIGSIAPWNYPLQMAAWKVLPALAAGNTVVLKPSELTPTTSVMFAEAAQEAGLPDGVFNVVTGTGPVVGEALVAHPEIAMVSFTGSTAVGRHIARQAAGDIKRLHLELGGKAPFLVFDDADLEAAARGAVAGALINSGQDCTAATRAYLQRPLYDAFVARVAELMGTVTLGPVDDTATDMGSLISSEQRDRVAAMVDRAREAGATIVCGGKSPGGSLADGAYYEPTLITDAAQDSEIVQHEVFGPVLACLPFDTDDEGIELANDTPYGLAASAWSRDVYRTGRASRELRAGCVWLNDHIPIISEMPHGGYKASGYGKDMSAYSFADYTQIKHVMSDVTGDQEKSWHELVFTGP